MAISIESQERDGWDVLAVTGEVDIRTAPQLRERISQLLTAGARRLVLDLEGVDFVDSTALSVMVGAHKQLAKQGGGLVLVCTREPVLRVLAVTGLSKVFEVHDSLQSVTTGRQTS
jgi:anti-sigma B factor antagonist